MLRDDPLPLPYSPMPIEDELRKIRWFRADQVSHHTIVLATSPTAQPDSETSLGIGGPWRGS